MAGIASKEGTLVASTAQTFGFAAALGNRAGSLLYCNDDASHTHAVSIDGVPFSVLPGEKRSISGLEGYKVATLGGDSGSEGAFRCFASESEVAPAVVAPNGGPVGTAAITDGSVTEPKLQPAGTLDVLGADRSFVADFDATSDASLRTVGDHLFGPALPIGAIITRCWWEVVDGFDSALSLAKLALGVEVDAAAGIKAATVVSNAAYVAPGNQPGLPTGVSVSGFTTKTTLSGRRFVGTVSVEDLTVGRLVLHGTYVVGA